MPVQTAPAEGPHAARPAAVARAAHRVKDAAMTARRVNADPSSQVKAARHAVTTAATIVDQPEAATIAARPETLTNAGQAEAGTNADRAVVKMPQNRRAGLLRPRPENGRVWSL